MKQLSWSEARDLLRTFRERNERNSADVVFQWRNCVQHNVNKLGNEKLLILEQVCIAALDRYQIDVADSCIKYLQREFPNSLRVKKLKAMKYEALESYDDAFKLLKAINKEDSTNSALKKRIVAILKSQGKNVDAIKELTDYLQTFMTDTEAWQELSELYLLEHDYAKAAFCVEELLLHSPHNHLLHQRYADIRYTQGGLDNMELARAYYAQALKLNPRNMRALYGLYLASSNIAVNQKTSSIKKKEATKLADWAFVEIKKKYKERGGSAVNIEEKMSALQIS